VDQEEVAAVEQRPHQVLGRLILRRAGRPDELGADYPFARARVPRQRPQVQLDHQGLVGRLLAEEQRRTGTPGHHNPLRLG
jgi:hypothetical protein